MRQRNWLFPGEGWPRQASRASEMPAPIRNLKLRLAERWMKACLAEPIGVNTTAVRVFGRDRKYPGVIFDFSARKE
ncbi:hypothetical protein EniyanLRS_172 [Mycobacterium phage EniyanLRS]|uniref:Uncharacterized protein n=1 Tax=Mycobacterium phage EniyanLRS TaxID=1933770 RepID=A0A6B9M467_9CAUD|nr:hypothetical protein EniyanLRS_172 [Mycobacterium phage EniyanLRS]